MFGGVNTDLFCPLFGGLEGPLFGGLFHGSWVAFSADFVSWLSLPPPFASAPLPGCQPSASA